MPEIDEGDIRARIRYFLDMPPGQSLNIDAPRRLSLNSPKKSSWTLREVFEEIEEFIAHGQ